MGIHYYDTSIYKFGNEYKVVYLKRYQADDLTLGKEFKKPEKLENGRFENNIARAKSTIMAIGLCNDWDFFCTFTLDKTKYDRFNLRAWQQDFSQWIRNQIRITGHEFKYLLIPELHKDGAWHMHGFVRGYSWDDLSLFLPEIHPYDLVKKGYRYHPGITEKFGFNSFGRIKKKEAATRYLLKYINKLMATINISLNSHLYYASQNLNRPELIANGMTPWVLTQCDYHNDFLHMGWLDLEDLYYVKNRLQ